MFMNKLFYKLLLLCFLLLVQGACMQAQNPDIKRTWNWYFGEQAGLNFSNGNITNITSSNMFSAESCASISDTCGNLLFYTDGDSVWNKNHQLMPDGIGLTGCYSSTQGVLIVPNPEIAYIYYLFISDCSENLGMNGVRYSVVDMSMNGGLGDVISKNNLLFSPCTEKLSATRHSNANDFWVVARKYNSQDFYVYLVSSAGIITTPVITSIGASADAIGDGYMRFSPNGNKLAAAYHTGNSGAIDTVEVYDFDKTTGNISNPITLIQDFGNEVYGVVFSPDNSKLYVSMYNINFGEKNKIFQYDLSSANPQTIILSKTLVYADDSLSYFSMQIRPDGKIFITRDGYYSSIRDTLATIHNPNAIGINCNFVKNDFYLNGNRSHIGLPNFIDSYFIDFNYVSCNNSVDEINSDYTISIYPNPFTDFFIIESKENVKQLEIKLFNIFGEVVLQKRVPTNELVYLNNISSDIYFLQVQSNNFISNYKIIKL